MTITQRSLVLTLCGTCLVAPGCPMDDDDPSGADTSSDTATASTTSGDDTSTASAADGSDTAVTESDGSTTDTSESEGATDSEGGTYAISGTVSRLRSASPSGDGIGTLYIAVFAACDLGAELETAAILPDADFSETDASVGFATAPVEPGTYAIALFLDDNLDADPRAPLPGPGDLIFGEPGDGVLSCVEVIVRSTDLDDVALTLNATVPDA